MATFTEPTRRRLLDRLTELSRPTLANQNGGMASGSLRATLESTYWKSLPRVRMSVCPFDGKPLFRTFDPFGFDGPWWDARQININEPRCCPHFFLIRGAVDLLGGSPVSGRFEAWIGPEKPFVIPRILNFPEVVAVVSEVRMATGEVVYPITYFGNPSPAPDQIPPCWPRRVCYYSTLKGGIGYRQDTDPWDFNLLPWLESGKVRWCEPNRENLVLGGGPPSQYPYFHLRGHQRSCMLENSTVMQLPPPDGDGELA